MDNIPGKRLAKKAEEAGNQVEVPMAQNLGLVELLKRLAKEIQEDHLAAFAGNLTYKGLFALFPFLVFLLSLLGLFGAPDLLGDLIDQARGVLPSSAVNLLEDQLLGIAGSRAQGAFTLGAIVSLLLALWGVSGAFRSVMEAMNVMYEIEEARPFWKQLLISVFLSLGVAALLIFALVLVVFGPEIGGAVADVVGLGSVFQIVWNIVQWPVLIFLVVFAFALVYYYAPDVEQRFRWISRFDRRGPYVAHFLAPLLDLRRKIRLLQRHLWDLCGHHHPHALRLLLGVHHARWRPAEPGHRRTHPRRQGRGRENAQHQRIVV